MKHAYLIITHNQFDLLKLLIKSLDHPQNYFFIHIDKKVKNFNVEDFKSITQHSNVTFTDRVSVQWGGYSMVNAELILLKEAIKGNYDYYHLLSGIDLPIKPMNQILEFFEQNKGTEFVHFCTPEFCQSINTIRRVKYYWPLQELFGRETGLYYYISKISLKLQEILHINRLKNQNLKIACGCQWFSITHALASYVLDSEAIIKKLCKHGICVDEVFLQTLVANSDFIKKVYKLNNDGDYISSVRYIDWERGTPYTFCKDDFDDLINSECLFARKFDIQTEPEICYNIFSFVTGDSNK